jgi:SMC interacting uncharacterized protein involved in chromosome segregation
MQNSAKVNSMRQKRHKYIGNIKAIDSDIDLCEQAEEHDVCLLEKYQNQLEEEWRRYRFTQDDLENHGEEDPTLEREAIRTYVSLGARL